MKLAAATIGNDMHPAVEDLMQRYSRALSLFCEQRTAQWDRTHQALACFAGLRLDLLPRPWRRRVDISFRRVNAVLAGYPIKTEQDYQLISAHHLQQIMDLVLDIPNAR